MTKNIIIYRDLKKMNFFFKILISLRWLKVIPELMNTWFLSNNKDLILFTLRKGSFQERLLAIETLAKLQPCEVFSLHNSLMCRVKTLDTAKKDETVIPYLLKTAQKDYEEIAMKALELASILDEKRLYTTEIEEVKLAWKKKLERKKNRVISSVNKHTRMKALENLRQQLKSPIGGGKWF